MLYASPRSWPSTVVLLLGIGLILGACDTSSNTVDERETDPAVEASAFTEAVASLSDAASLSASQTTALQNRVAAYDEDERAPGMLWSVAADVHAELTSEQLDQLKNRLQERRAHRRHDGDRRKRRGHVQKRLRHRMMSGLDLTDDQKRELRALRAEHRDQMKALRQKCRAGTLNDADAEEWRAQRSEMRASFRNVLTSEQRSQLKTRRETFKDRRADIRHARAEALALTDEQRAQFADLRAQHEGPGHRLLRRCQGGAPQQRPGASILTAEQKEIVMIHRVLRHRAVRAHKNRGPKG